MVFWGVGKVIFLAVLIRELILRHGHAVRFISRSQCWMLKAAVHCAIVPEISDRWHSSCAKISNCENKRLPKTIDFSVFPSVFALGIAKAKEEMFEKVNI